MSNKGDFLSQSPRQKSWILEQDSFHFHFIYWLFQIFTIIFSHCPQIAKATIVYVGSVCLKQNTHSWYYIKLTGPQKVI